MKKMVILLPLTAAVIFIPFKQTGASSLGSPKPVQADAAIPVASSVIGVSGAISGVGVAGHLLFNRRQK